MSCQLKLTFSVKYKKVYRSQGVEIGDKHIEVMVRQMIRKVRVMDPGDTDLLMGTLMDINDFTDANKDVLIAGGVPATGRPVLMGITKASLETIVSCQLLPSRKQLVSLQMRLSVVRKTISLVSRKMLLSVRLSQLVQVWHVTVTLNHKQSTKSLT